ncbi:MAG: 6-phosphogluconolactonase [Acidobacteriota bacterium]|nr:6-phosphogluconolactonase [Acidobacteriota bacterium]
MDPEILIFKTPLEAAAACGVRSLEILQQARGERGSASVAVSGGSTPRMMFDDMASQTFDWSAIDIFQVDERCVPPDHAQSNFRMLRETLLRNGAILQSRVHRIEGERAPAEAALEYSAEIRRSFGLTAGALPTFDLIQRGMGADAHTASLFPGDKLIEDRTGIAAAVENASLEKSMQHRATLLRGVLEQARHTFCLVAGADKAEALRVVLRSPFNPVKWPSQIASAGMVWFVDEAAASKL